MLAKADFENLINKARAWDYLMYWIHTESLTCAIDKREQNKCLVEMTKSLVDLEAKLSSTADNMYLQQVNTRLLSVRLKTRT